MPTYDYKCKACSHTFEHRQSMKDAQLRKCPACGKNQLERLIGVGAAILFKGSGFYQTDYRSESYKAGHKADNPPPDTKADTKPDTSSKSKSDSTKQPTTADAGAKPVDSPKSSEPKSSDSKPAKDKGSKDVSPRKKKGE